MLKVRNFEKYQHYRHRAPIWIKLYRSLLRDYQFQQLPDAARSHLMMIWLLASELDNQIENDPEWVRRQIGATEPVDLQLLIGAGFLVDLDSAVEQNGSNPASKVSEDMQNLASGVLLVPETALAQSRAEQRQSRDREEAAAEQRQPPASPLAADPTALPAAAANSDFAEPHSSVFQFSTCEDFVRATKPHIRNPGGLARRLWRSGEEDGAIGQWRIEQEERRELEERLRDSEAVIDFDWDAHADDLIARNDLTQLQNELEGIEERGGPLADWERRVIAYFNNQSAASDAA